MIWQRNYESKGCKEEPHREKTSCETTTPLIVKTIFCNFLYKVYDNLHIDKICLYTYLEIVKEVSKNDNIKYWGEHQKN